MRKYDFQHVAPPRNLYRSHERWYIERAVWLIAGFVLLSSTALAVLLNPVCILGVVATGLVSINVALTGFCPIGSLLQLLGFTPMLGADKPSRWNLYFLKIDRWYLERRIYVTVELTHARITPFSDA